MILRRRPWGMRLNGDIWAAAASLLTLKGPDNVQVVWTKGHATDNDIEQGTSTEENRDGNNIADQLARAAHDLQPRDKQIANGLAHARWAAAEQVVDAVHAFLRDAIVERDRVRNDKRRTIEINRNLALERKTSGGPPRGSTLKATYVRTVTPGIQRGLSSHKYPPTSLKMTSPKSSRHFVLP